MRHKAGLTQRDLAERAHVNYTYVSKIENGHAAPPSRETLALMADAMDADFDELIALAKKRTLDEVIEWLDQSIRNDEEWMDLHPDASLRERSFWEGGHAALVELWEYLTGEASRPAWARQRSKGDEQ